MAKSTEYCHSFSAHGLPDFLCTRSLHSANIQLSLASFQSPENFVENVLPAIIAAIYLLVVLVRFLAPPQKRFRRVTICKPVLLEASELEPVRKKVRSWNENQLSEMAPYSEPRPVALPVIGICASEHEQHSANKSCLQTEQEMEDSQSLHRKIQKMSGIQESFYRDDFMTIEIPKDISREELFEMVQKFRDWCEKLRKNAMDQSIEDLKGYEQIYSTLLNEKEQESEEKDLWKRKCTELMAFLPDEQRPFPENTHETRSEHAASRAELMQQLEEARSAQRTLEICLGDMTRSYEAEQKRAEDAEARSSRNESQNAVLQQLVELGDSDRNTLVSKVNELEAMLEELRGDHKTRLDQCLQHAVNDNTSLLTKVRELENKLEEAKQEYDANIANQLEEAKQDYDANLAKLVELGVAERNVLLLKVSELEGMLENLKGDHKTRLGQHSVTETSLLSRVREVEKKLEEAKNEYEANLAKEQELAEVGREALLKKIAVLETKLKAAEEAELCSKERCQEINVISPSPEDPEERLEALTEKALSYRKLVARFETNLQKPSQFSKAQRTRSFLYQNPLSPLPNKEYQSDSEVPEELEKVFLSPTNNKPKQTFEKYTKPEDFERNALLKRIRDLEKKLQDAQAEYSGYLDEVKKGYTEKLKEADSEVMRLTECCKTLQAQLAQCQEEKETSHTKFTLEVQRLNRETQQLSEQIQDFLEIESDERQAVHRTQASLEFEPEGHSALTHSPQYLSTEEGYEIVLKSSPSYELYSSGNYNDQPLLMRDLEDANLSDVYRALAVNGVTDYHLCFDLNDEFWVALEHKFNLAKTRWIRAKMIVSRGCSQVIAGYVSKLKAAECDIRWLSSHCRNLEAQVSRFHGTKQVQEGFSTMELVEGVDANFEPQNDADEIVNSQRDFEDQRIKMKMWLEAVEGHHDEAASLGQSSGASWKQESIASLGPETLF